MDNIYPGKEFAISAAFSASRTDAGNVANMAEAGPVSLDGQWEFYWIDLTAITHDILNLHNLINRPFNVLFFYGLFFFTFSLVAAHGLMLSDLVGKFILILTL